MTGQEQPSIPGLAPAGVPSRFRYRAATEPSVYEPAPLSESEEQRRIVYTHRLWDIGEQLRNIQWPRKWLDRLGSAFSALAVACLGGALATTKYHSAFMGHENGYYVAAALSALVAVICYMADKRSQEQPEITVGRTVQKMEELGWITPLDRPPQKTRRERYAHFLLRWPTQPQNSSVADVQTPVQEARSRG